LKKIPRWRPLNSNSTETPSSSFVRNIFLMQIC
jgi:hypothetical protein